MQSFLFSRAGLTTLIFLAVGGYFLWAEHEAHFIAALPWILLGGCVVMHLFMDHGHRDRGAGKDAGAKDHVLDRKERGAP